MGHKIDIITQFNFLNPCGNRSTGSGIFCRFDPDLPSVVSHKNVTKVVQYILVQLSSLNNTMSMVSGVSVQVSGAMKIQRAEHRKQMTEDNGQTVSAFCHLLSDT